MLVFSKFPVHAVFSYVVTLELKRNQENDRSHSNPVSMDPPHVSNLSKLVMDDQQGVYTYFAD